MVSNSPPTANSTVLRDPSCNLCSLGVVSQPALHRQNLCIPTRLWLPPVSCGNCKIPVHPEPGILPNRFICLTCGWTKRPVDWSTGRRVLLVVGEAPGFEEDKQGLPFVGPSGKILDGWLRAMPLGDVDVFLTNAVRCRLPDGVKFAVPQTRTCQDRWLKPELAELRTLYGDRITILLLGASAVTAFGRGGTLKDSLRIQGLPLEIDGHSYPCYSTYHPAFLIPRRQPAAMTAVADHLELLSRHLTGKIVAVHVAQPVVCCPPPPVDFPRIIALDIETYGILKSLPPQTVYHPEKSRYVDGCPRDQLIQTVGLSWAPSATDLDDPDWGGQGCKTAVFRFGVEEDRITLWCWLSHLRAIGGTLLCMNTLFDIGYLRYFPWLRKVLSPPLMLEDLAIWNNLSSDRRPEKGLEALSRLLGLTGPPKSADKKFQQYDSVDDPKLQLYNVTDCVWTLVARGILRRQAQPRARSEYTRRFFSNQIWSCMEMSSAGLQLSRSRLSTLATSLTGQIAGLEARYKLARGSPISGKGSQAPIRQLFKDAVAAAGVRQDPRLIITRLTGIISTGEENQELLSSTLPLAHPLRPVLEMVRDHRAVQKVYGSFVSPLLSPSKSVRLSPAGLSFPSWFVAPMEYGGSSQRPGGKEGGTVQGRITCKSQAHQTDPPVVADCYVSRFAPFGVLTIFDLSQIEYRVATLLSGDPIMMHEYQAGLDRHTIRAIEIFGQKDWDTAGTADRKLWRKVGKTANFLLIFRGGWKVFQEMLRREVGLERDKSWCQTVVRDLVMRHPVFTAWQDSLIAQVTRDGYLEEPILGHHRFFTRSPTVNQSDYESTIVNFPVQFLAATLMLDVQYSFMQKIQAAGLRSRVVMNKYDSIVVDSPSCETKFLGTFFRKSLTESSFRSKLESSVGRRVPILYETDTRAFVTTK